MKTLTKILAAAAVLLFSASCNKDDNSPAPKQYLSQQEVIAKLDSAGLAALEQVVPEDFRNFIYTVNDGKAVVAKADVFTADSTNRAQWRKQMNSFFLRWHDPAHPEKGKDYLLDGKKFGGYGVVSLLKSDTSFVYTYDGHETAPFTFDVKSVKNYKGKLKVTCSEKDTVKIGRYGASIDSIYTLSPTKVECSFAFGAAESASATLNTDFSAISGWDLSDIWSILFNLDKIAFTANGEVKVVNGTNSYKVKVNNLAFKDLTATADLTVCGKDGNDLVNIAGNARIDTTRTSEQFIVTDGWKLNLMNGTVEVKLKDEKADVYFKGYTQPQMTIDVTTKAITFADGSKSTCEEFFTVENFSETVVAAYKVAVEFYLIIQGLI